MGIITGGAVSPPGVKTPGSAATIYYTNAVPTDETISSAFTPANGDLAQNVVTGFLYERQAGVWVRVDTL